VKGGTGFRGLVATVDQASGATHLLVAQEGNPFLILNVDPIGLTPPALKLRCPTKRRTSLQSGIAERIS
jgi:hypothetical protein